MHYLSERDGFDIAEVSVGSRRLDDDDVSSQERWRNFARGEEQREVPRYYGCHYTYGCVSCDDCSLLVVLDDIFGQRQVSHAPDPSNCRIRLGICLRDLINQSQHMVIMSL